MLRIVPFLIAALFVAPVVGADPVAGGNLNYVKLRWQFGAQSGECTDRIAFTTVQAQFKLLVAVQSTRDAVPEIGIPGSPTGFLPDSMCALLITIAPGAYTNACAVLAGEPHIPVGVIDPYFHYSYGYYYKSIAWNQGQVNYKFQTSYDAVWDKFRGDCRWGAVTGSWDFYPSAIYV